MSFNYKVIISTTEPENMDIGDIWIKPEISFANVKITGWAQLAGDSPIVDVAYVAGTYTKTMVEQATEPTKVVGLIWKNTNTNTYYICLNTWVDYAGL